MKKLKNQLFALSIALTPISAAFADTVVLNNDSVSEITKAEMIAALNAFIKNPDAPVFLTSKKEFQLAFDHHGLPKLEDIIGKITGNNPALSSANPEDHLVTTREIKKLQEEQLNAYVQKARDALKIVSGLNEKRGAFNPVTNEMMPSPSNIKWFHNNNDVQAAHHHINIRFVKVR